MRGKLTQPTAAAVGAATTSRLTTAAPCSAARSCSTAHSVGGSGPLTDANRSRRDGAANQALNTVNGDVFRWRRMWDVIATDLGVATGPYPGHARSLAEEMIGEDERWDAIVERHGLKPTKLTELASWWHTDGDLGREVQTFADMTKSRSLGFYGFRNTRRTFLGLFDRLRAERIIP